ncbi:MAG: hypothetical protein WC121_04235 [Candidatus Kapaibacterium sp.]
MKKILLLITLTLFIISCGKEERVIDNSVVSLGLYLADSVTNDISVYHYPTMEISKANLLANAGISISSPISNIREFQKRIYILVPGEDKMIVLDAVSDTLLAVNEFPLGSEPFDISFANVADGFVMFRNLQSITNYDLVFNKSARTLEGKSLITSIVDYGSFSFMTEPQTQSVSVLDNRSYKIDGEIKVTGIPILSAITSESEVFVVSQGYTTQVGEEAPVTIPTQVHFINPNDRTVRYTRDMGDNFINANEVIPTDLATTPIGYAFATTNKGLLRLDTRNNGNLFDVSKRIFSRIEYNAQRNGLYMLEHLVSGAKIAEASAVSGRVVGDIEIPRSTNCFHLSN